MWTLTFTVKKRERNPNKVLILQLHLTLDLKFENALDFFFDFLNMYFLKRVFKGIYIVWSDIFYYATKDVLINRTRMPSH